MTCLRSTRFAGRLLLLGLLAPAAVEAHEPPLHNYFQVIEMFPIAGFCPGADVRAGYDFASFDCDTLADPNHTLTTSEMTAFTGLPWHDMSSLYPNWNCVPAVPGPLWVVDQCNPKPDCEPDCSDEAVSDPSASLGGGLDLSTGFLGQTPAADLDLGHGLRFERHYASPKSSSIGPMGRAWEHSLQWGLRRTTAVLDSGSRPVVAVDAPFQPPAVFMYLPADDSYHGSQRGSGSSRSRRMALPTTPPRTERSRPSRPRTNSSR